MKSWYSVACLVLACYSATAGTRTDERAKWSRTVNAKLCQLVYEQSALVDESAFEFHSLTVRYELGADSINFVMWGVISVAHSTVSALKQVRIRSEADEIESSPYTGRSDDAMKFLPIRDIVVKDILNHLAAGSPVTIAFEWNDSPATDLLIGVEGFAEHHKAFTECIAQMSANNALEQTRGQ
jgi:hypothetical protein